MSKTPEFRNCLLQVETYVPGKPIEEVKRELGLDEVIKLASNENPLGGSSKAMEAMKKAIEQIHLYPDGSCFELRQKLAVKLGVDNGNLIFGTGGDEVIFYFAQSFFCKDDEVIIPECTFSEYETSAILMDINIIRTPLLADWNVDFDALTSKISNKTKAIYLTNPNNPTGTLISSDKIEYILNNMPENCFLFLDEAYYEFVDDPNYTKAIEWIKEDRNIIVLRTFSKIYGLAGTRVGYGIAPTRIIDLMEKVRLPFNVNSIAQCGAIAALDDVEHVNTSREVNFKGKKFLYAEFEKLGLNYVPSSANFVWLDTKKDSRYVFKELLKLGVIVRVGAAFGADTYIRVTVGTQYELDKFITALKVVLK